MRDSHSYDGKLHSIVPMHSSTSIVGLEVLSSVLRI